MSTVLRGDVVNVAASLGCVNAIGGAVQVRPIYIYLDRLLYSPI